MQLARGQRIKLADIGLSNTFSIELALAAGALSVDASCFGLDASRRLLNDDYMIFFNQKISPCGGVKLDGISNFAFDLSRVPASIEVMTIALAIDGNGTMSSLGDSRANFISEGGARASFAFSGKDFSAERALMLLEIYRKDGLWRFCAVAQGFNGGLDALVSHFGGTLAAAPQTPPPAPTPQTPPPVPAPQPSGVNLSKITLEKRGDKISLEKRGDAGHGRIVCNLNWTSGKGEKRGFFGLGRSKGIDLDLGCLFELADGSKGAVQALGNSFGAYDYEPYIHLAGDDRTGASASGEFLYINGDHLPKFRRICVFAFIYEGIANWSQADAVVTITVPGHPTVEVRLDGHNNQKNMCGIAMLENVAGSLRVTKLAEYVGNHLELDRRYNWGLRWQAGSKD
ncbi:MAG: TerD family protein [Betaproteobacteria bacterium]|nr:TerD family protein [Betaproteobacteria bacterium]